MPEQFHSGFVDRIEDGQYAVLLVDDTVERVVPAEQLPEGASGGSWLRVRFDGDAIAEASIDHQKQAEMRERIGKKMERLRRRVRRKGREGT